MGFARQAKTNKHHCQGNPNFEYFFRVSEIFVICHFLYISWQKSSVLVVSLFFLAVLCSSVLLDAVTWREERKKDRKNRWIVAAEHWSCSQLRWFIFIFAFRNRVSNPDYEILFTILYQFSIFLKQILSFYSSNRNTISIHR